MANRNKIAPLPYSLQTRGLYDENEYVIEDDNGENIAQITDMPNNYIGVPVPDAKQTGEFIVKACINFHPLLKALKLTLEYTNAVPDKDWKIIKQTIKNAESK